MVRGALPADVSAPPDLAADTPHKPVIVSKHKVHKV
jgi:hypothetical protein